ncbi:MAG: hypothetical protein ABIO60_05255, partial [Aquaticitalea sp.]
MLVFFTSAVLMLFAQNTTVSGKVADASNIPVPEVNIQEEEDSSGEYPGEWFRRASYPSTELNRNRLNVEANQQTPITPVWW